MSEHIINVTTIWVQQEIQRFFEKYPEENPYKVIFSRSYFQKELLKKILSQIPNPHLVIHDREDFINYHISNQYSLEEKEKIVTLIKKNIPKILTENYQQVGEILVKERSKTNLALIWEDD